MYTSNGISPLGISIKTIPNGAHIRQIALSIIAHSQNVMTMSFVFRQVCWGVWKRNILFQSRNIQKCFICEFPEDFLYFDFGFFLNKKWKWNFSYIFYLSSTLNAKMSWNLCKTGLKGGHLLSKNGFPHKIHKITVSSFILIQKYAEK